MLVEINLLPEREPRKFAFVIILSSFISLILIVSAFYFWQLNTTKNEIDSVDRQISMTQKIAAKETTTTNTPSTTNSESQLENAIKWANDYSIQTIPVMRKLTSLLPERGFIQSFGYTEAGDVTLTVQFDSAREAAYFLSSLNGSDWIKDASLISLTTSATAENSGTVVNGSTGSTANPAAQTNTTSAVQNGQNTSTSTTTTVNTASTTTDQYLPRYVGQFQITLNKEVIKKQTNKGTNDQEGVTGS